MADKKPTQKSQENTAPSVVINAQYTKDLSFESPNSPHSLVLIQKSQPNVDLSVNLDAKKIQDNSFEVTLHILVKANVEKETVFVNELKYAGLFTLTNVPEEQMEPVLLIHCPHLIFPFARRIVADATRDAGFQPLLIDPIDFGNLYAQRKQEAETQKAN